MAPEPTSYKNIPGDRITIACFTYMARTMELIGFSSFFYGIILGADKISLGLTEESKKAFLNEASKYQNRPGGFFPARQLINEILLSRSVDSFHLYLIQFLRLLFSVRTNLVIEEEKIVDEAIKAKLSNADEYFLHLAECKLDLLSRKPLSALREYIITSTGIDIFEEESLYETVILARELRNLAAHNDCRVDESFLRRLKDVKDVPPVDLGYRFAINDGLLKKCFGALDHIVFSFDAKAAIQNNLPTLNRATYFLHRGDFAASTI